MKVVIGAGPAGLYTAIKLRKAGVKDVVVYDPRAGTYTRPGHLDYIVFEKAKRGTGANIDTDLLSGTSARSGHIKDLERELYSEAKRLGIRIENKRFINIIPHASKPAVVVADVLGHEEVVDADYVFDCTGTRRRVINAVNALSAEPPFKITTITDLPVKNHFIAYVRMPSNDYSRLKMAIDTYNAMGSLLTDTLTEARLFLKLRGLGWPEFKLPRLYCSSFGKRTNYHKACLYLHAPAGLRNEDYDEWVRTVIESYAPSIHFEHYPAPRKYSSKPRFMSFELNAEALTRVSYKGETLPTVIALGDAQIGFDYALGHGISDGIERIDALFEHMELFDGNIQYFDAEEYLSQINLLLREHKAAVISEAERLKASFSKELGSAQYKFREAAILSLVPAEKSLFTSILAEIEARLSYIKAAAMFTTCHDATHKVTFSSATLSTVTAKINAIHSDLLNAYTHLPVSFISEQRHTKTLLTYLAESWKTVGNVLVKNSKHAEAIEAYKKAITIYNLPSFAGHHALNELPLYSNVVITYLKGQHFPEAIAAGKTALATYTRCEAEPKPTALYEKIVFNLLKAMCSQVKALLLIREKAEATSLRSQAEHLLQTHQTALEGENHAHITTMMHELQASLAVSSPALAALALKRAESLGTLRLPSAATGAPPEPLSQMELPAGSPYLPKRASSISEGTQTDDVADSAATANQSAVAGGRVATASSIGLFSEGIKPPPINEEKTEKVPQISQGCCSVA